MVDSSTHDDDSLTSNPAYDTMKHGRRGERGGRDVVDLSTFAGEDDTPTATTNPAYEIIQ